MQNSESRIQNSECGRQRAAREGRVLYAGAIALEALVLAVIWLIQRHFGA